MGIGGEEVSAIIFADTAGDAGDANTDFLGYKHVLSLSHTHTYTRTHTHTHTHTKGPEARKRSAGESGKPLM